MLAFLIGIWQITLKRMWERFSAQQQARWAWLVHLFNLSMYLLAAIVLAQILKLLLNLHFTGDVFVLTTVLFTGIVVVYWK